MSISDPQVMDFRKIQILKDKEVNMHGNRYHRGADILHVPD